MFTERLENQKGKNFDYKWGLIKVIMSTLKSEIIIATFIGMLAELLNITNFFLISFYIDWIRDEEEVWIGFILTLSIGIILITSLFVKQKFLFQTRDAGLNLRKMISGVLFKKIITLNQEALATTSSGKIVSLINGEFQEIEDGFSYLIYLVIAPISTIYAFILIAINFGEAALIGFILFILILICQFIMSKATAKWKYLEGLYSGHRIKAILEVIHSIRTIKCFTWESKFKEIILNWRRKHFKMIRKPIFNSIGSGIFLNSGYLIG